MINLKIKTLDSQDHDFSVNEEITVRQFKEHISANTGVAADNQRLIYCGRVLQDAKLLREYDVNGKVVHLVEGAPPRSRSAADAQRSDGHNHQSSTNRRREQIDGGGGGRQPIFRTIDGMVLGAMAIPMNNGDGTTQTVSNLSNSFSTLCMNRITVARHMLECVNNIINYLDNPEVGLNNNDIDIQRTMESTIFEVGISTLSEVEVPQQVMQNFVQVFQGAVSAAFRQNGLTNVEVGGTQPSAGGGTRASVVGVADGTTTSENNIAASINILMDQQMPGSGANIVGVHANSSAAANGSTPATAPPSNESQSSGTPSRTRNQTTSTLVLAEVVQQMRTTQSRLEPYLQQYYDLLQNEPTFAENETQTRENAQRVFDRVSEAIHYLAHAQHAISDLMLDLTLPAPRHLCCRPILVEQSAFVSSGFTLPASLRRDPSSNNNESAAANNNTVNAEQQQQLRQHINIIQPSAPLAPGEDQHHHILDSVGFIGFPPEELNANGSQSNGNDRQMEMAQLIRAVVNSVPLHTDVRVEISRRNDDSPTSTTTTTNAQTSTTDNTAVAADEGNATRAQSQQTSSPTTSDTSTSTSTDGGGLSQPRVTTATHPTTATQTRSTARPQSQIQLTGLPVGPLRALRPVSVQSSFDRFLPCSSHHVRENRERQNTPHHAGQPIGVTLTNAQPIPVRRNRRDTAPTATMQSTVSMRAPSAVQLSSASTATAAAAATSNADDPLSTLTNEQYSTPVRIFGSQLPIRELVHIAPNPAALNRIRVDLHRFVVQIFGSPLIESNMANILENINGILNLSSINANAAENPSFDALNSVNNLIRHTLPTIVNLILEDDSTDFGMRLLRALIEFVRRLLMVLVVCVGRQVAWNFIREMTDICLPEPEASERTAIAAFKRHILAAARRQFDIQYLDTSDVNEFLVIRLPQSSQSDGQQQQQVSDATTNETNSSDMSITDADEPMETESIPENNSDSLANLINRLAPTLPPLVQPTEQPIVREPLPEVLVGSASWHSAIPTQWIPTISQDVIRQRRTTTQGPYSDGYLSGMSSKRRKLIASKKPNLSNTNQFITDTFRHVARANGLQSQSNTAAVEEALTSNVQLHEPYGSLEQRIRQHIEARLSNDNDFNPSRFPNCSKWLDKK